MTIQIATHIVGQKGQKGNITAALFPIFCLFVSEWSVEITLSRATTLNTPTQNGQNKMLSINITSLWANFCTTPTTSS